MAGPNKPKQPKANVFAGTGSFADMLRQRKMLVQQGKLQQANQLSRAWRKKNNI